MALRRHFEHDPLPLFQPNAVPIHVARLIEAAVCSDGHAQWRCLGAIIVRLPLDDLGMVAPNKSKLTAVTGEVIEQDRLPGDSCLSGDDDALSRLAGHEEAAEVHLQRLATLSAGREDLRGIGHVTERQAIDGAWRAAISERLDA